MLNELTAIKIKGANFLFDTQLSLLNNENHNPVKATILYGRNGSGKSTIAKAFRKIKGENIGSVSTALSLDSIGNPVSLSNDEKGHLYIFDDDYIESNVRVQNDGLGSIVMLGEQVGLADRITAASEELRHAETDRDQKKIIVEEYNNSENQKSPQYYIYKTYTVLQGDNGWAGRKRKIDGLRKNASVTAETYKDFVDLRPEKTRDELIVDFNSKWADYEAAQAGTHMLTKQVPSMPQEYYLYSIESGNELLKKIIEKPELTEREEYILSLVQTGRADEIRTISEEFQNNELQICPKCFQPLSFEYKTQLCNSIRKVLSEEVKHHQALLRLLQISLLEIDISDFSGLRSYTTCLCKINALNEILQNNNALLQSKIDDPYTPIENELTDISEIIDSLANELSHLEEDRQEFNRGATNTEIIKEELTRINNEIAHYDVIDLAKWINIRTVEKNAAEEEYNNSGNIFNEKQNAFNQLNAERNSIHIAIDIINESLRYIFFSENRMKIQIVGDKYRILCNGHPVKPQDISVGEKNIIGLIYFFTSILQGKDRANAYSEEYLLIIDDPISSYDLENRVGILSYLKYELGMFLSGNSNTRSIIMTHDLLTAIDLRKLHDELMKECDRVFNGQGNNTFFPYELKDNGLRRFLDKRNEYTELMSLVYEYANGSIEHEMYIGNIMRQVMEAYATFVFKKGIAEVSTDPEILALIQDMNLREHFKNLMYRLVLNEGSHRYDQTRNMQIDFLTMISEPDKRRTAKEILCFIYLISPLHVKAHLGAQCCVDILTWCTGLTNGENIP